VTGDARAFLAERFLGDLDDDFLPLLQKVGNQLRTALLRAVMPVAVTAVVRAAAPVVAAAAIASASPRGILHSRAEIAGDASLPRLLFLGRRTCVWNGQTVINRCYSGFRFQRVLGLFERFDRFVRFGFRVGFILGGRGERIGIGHFFESALVGLVGFGGGLDHAFGLGRVLFLFEFVVFACLAFACRRYVGCGEGALLRLARRVFALRLGDLLGERAGFFLGQFRRQMVLVQFLRARFLMGDQALGGFDLFLFRGGLGMRQHVFQNGFGVGSEVRFVHRPFRERLAGQRRESGSEAAAVRVALAGRRGLWHRFVRLCGVLVNRLMRFDRRRRLRDGFGGRR